MKQDVNYILHHKNAYIRMMEDDISCVDMSVYNALFLIWNRCDFDTNLSINRNDVMKLAKVGNANTYTKSLKTLHEKKYIEYHPSNNPLIGSKVTIIRCDKGTGKGTAKSSDISSGASTDNSSDISSDTLYKQVKQFNNLTTEQINNILAFANNLSSFELKKFLDSMKKEDKPERFSFKSELIKYGFQENLVSDWITVRKTKRASNTQTAFDSFISEIEKKPCDINEMLSIAVTNSWSGFKHAWVDNLNNNKNGKSKLTDKAEFIKLTNEIRDRDPTI